MKKQIRHIANPLQTTEIEIAELHHDQTLGLTGAMVATTSGYVHTTDIHGDASLTWMSAGCHLHPAHCFSVMCLSPADLAILAA